MENENKDLETELELETQDTVPAAEETEFDPTESEDFYNNLEAAIGSEDDTGFDELPELLLPEETFALDSADGQTAGESEEEEIFAGVDAALSEHIEREFGTEPEYENIEDEDLESDRRVFPKWAKILVGVIFTLLLSIGLLFGTPGGRKLIVNIVVSIAFRNVTEDEDPTPTPDITDSPDFTVTPGGITEPPAGPTIDPAKNPDASPAPTNQPDVSPGPTITPTPTIVIKDDKNIINVLLLGEENIYGANRGRTDAIIVASIDLRGGPIKLVSFQRDLYVKIPGHDEDRINTAYRKGNNMLVVETVEQNFGIDIDGYLNVNFKGFENLIDHLGGVTLSLTAKESEYLNTTEYISKPSERNTVAGEQLLTGAQVLGYCRVRYVPTANGLTNDRGRNYRHRLVLQALFDKFKSQNLNITQLNAIMNECFPYVTVSSNLEDLAKKCLFAVVENRMFEIETMQVPQNKQYSGAIIDGKDVIVFFPGCVEQLQEFLYGDN